MPRLLSINNYHYPRGGADNVYLQHSALFDSRGWDVACFSMKHEDNIQSEWSKYFVSEIELGKSYSFKEKIESFSKIVWSSEARGKIRHLIRDFQPNVAHAHNIYHHISPSILRELKQKRIPVVLTAHDLKILCPAYKMLNANGVCEACKKNKIWNVALKKCLHESRVLSTAIFVESAIHRLIDVYNNNIDIIIVPSKFYFKKFVEWGYPEKKLRYVPNFVQKNTVLDVNTSKKDFVYFGRLSREKGLFTLLKAASKCGLRIRIVGSGPDERLLKEYAAEVGAPATFVGRMSGAALRAEIASARTVILPSEWYENAPMSVLEAFELGVPVIGADIGGIPELIAPGETGWLFESGDADALSHTMDAAASTNDALLTEMGRRARAQIHQSFLADGYLQSVSRIYEELGVR